MTNSSIEIAAYRRGQKGVCIDASWRNNNVGGGGVEGVEGAKYKISAVMAAPKGTQEVGLTVLRLVETDNLRHPTLAHPAYLADRFRPLVSKTLEEDARMIRELVDNMDSHSRLERIEELLNE